MINVYYKNNHIGSCVGIIRNKAACLVLLNEKGKDLFTGWHKHYCDEEVNNIVSNYNSNSFFYLFLMKSVDLRSSNIIENE